MHQLFDFSRCKCCTALVLGSVYPFFICSYISFYIDQLNVCVHASDLHNRNQVLMKPVLVINLEVKDNHEEAAIGGRLALQLCQEVYLRATQNFNILENRFMDGTKYACLSAPLTVNVVLYADRGY